MIFSVHFIIFEGQKTRNCIFIKVVWWMIERFKPSDAEKRSSKNTRPTAKISPFSSFPKVKSNLFIYSFCKK